MTNSMDRRSFLKKSAACAGLMLAVSLSGFPPILAAEKRTDTGNNQWIPNAWLRMTPDGVVTVLINKSELGQGTWTGLAMLVADQLDMDWKDVRVEASPVRDEYKDPIFGMQLTGGSTGIRNMYDTMSKAGAAAREMLISAAASEWKVPIGECLAQKGNVTHQKTGKTLSYRQLCSQAAKVPVPQNPPLKPRDQFQFIGKNMPRLDMFDKVNGKPVFGVDVFVPGMLYSSIERPPAYGAKLVSFDKAAAEKVPGVQKVFTVPEGVAVVATNIESAWKGRKALNAKWDLGSMPDLNDTSLQRIFMDHMRKKGLVTKNVGDVEQAFKKASQRMMSVYSAPYVAHAAFEPQNCTADVRPDSCEIWCPTQAQTSALNVAMKETGLPADKITIHTTMLGGGFGGKVEVKVVEEAVMISRTVGKPVKHIWSRKEDFNNDCFRPGSLHMIEGGLDDKGVPVLWRHKVVVSPIMERLLPAMVKGGIDPTAVDGIANMDYSMPNLYVEYVKLDLPIPVGFWRSVGNSSNTFVVESFIDEMAHGAGKDPLEFRLNMLKENPRAAGVLKKVADAGGWSNPAPKDIGRGIAVRFSYGSYVAQMAEVSVDKKTGVIKVHRMVSAIDPGQVVNPDSVLAQIEGATIMAISVALKERVSFKNGGVATSSFSDYPILTMSEIPRIEGHIITNNEKIGGVGEPCVPPVAPAIANAVFAATGLRLRSLPMTADKVRSAFKAKA
ncbi:MAG: xanthine dehydrogenase family protein molybdopterin-binding subunit [Deltaproteobacteria bacterium]|nr:xanthine dehydrogenase family protein molybdopterin-binding subunit [Deltaproteobacteria bacterium]